MCGRYVLATGASELATAFGATDAGLDLRPNWNVAPTSSVPIVLREGPSSRTLAVATWGFDAPWSDRGLVINARGESVGQKRMFARLLKGGRCIVPMDGYYEWKRSTGPGRGSKTPFFIRPRAGLALNVGGTGAALGLHDREAGRMVLLTRDAPPGVVAIHDRMPLLAARELVESWLDGSCDPRDLAGPPPDDELMEWWQVDRAVNSSRSSGPGLLAPVRDEGLFG
jgi:putative SOS response-associated peptidase YedK